MIRVGTSEKNSTKNAHKALLFMVYVTQHERAEYVTYPFCFFLPSFSFLLFSLSPPSLHCSKTPPYMLMLKKRIMIILVFSP